MKKSIFYVAIMSLFLCGCNSDDSVLENQNSDELSIQFKRSITEVVDIANQYGKSISASSRSKQNLVDESNVTPILGVTSRSSADTLLYAVDFNENNGFLIVSASKTTEPILAIIENGTYDEAEQESVPGFDYFVDAAKSYVRSSFNAPVQGGIVGGDDFIMAWYTDTLESVFMGDTRLKTKWGQFWPENEYCPNKIAGCIPVAIAQVFSYFKPEMKFNVTFPEKPVDYIEIDWDKVSSHLLSPSYKSPSQNLIDSHIAGCGADADAHEQISILLRQIGHWGHARYYENVTEMNFSDGFRVCDFYLHGRNITSISSSVGFYDVMKEEGLALIMGTDISVGGHGWVLDGVGNINYIIRNYTNYNPKTHEYSSLETELKVAKYVHCNWGWNGSFNGYVLEGVYDSSETFEPLLTPVSRYNFTSNLVGHVYK